MLRLGKRVIVMTLVAFAIIAALVAIAMQFQGGREFVQEHGPEVSDVWTNHKEGGDMTLDDLEKTSPTDAENSPLEDAKRNARAFQDRIDSSYQSALDALSPTPE